MTVSAPLTPPMRAIVVRVSYAAVLQIMGSKSKFVEVRFDDKRLSMIRIPVFGAFLS